MKGNGKDKGKKYAKQMRTGERKQNKTRKWVTSEQHHTDGVHECQGRRVGDKQDGGHRHGKQQRESDQGVDVQPHHGEKHPNVAHLYVAGRWMKGSE